MRRDFVKKLKYIFLFLISIFVFYLVFQWKLVFYGASQLKGQLSIISQTEKLENVLHDKTFPDSLKQKIRLIQEIKQFAVDSLGLNYSENYTTFYNQHEKPILWVITAAPPFELIPKTWTFPFLGDFSYKGFFNKEMADEELAVLKKDGFDVQMNEVSAWSTLGYLNDPILSSMLNKSEGSLARLIIHEMTHGTIFVKNNLEFNENLADFIGEIGAKYYLESKYGVQSEEAIRLEKSKILNEKYSNHLMRGANALDSLYQSFRGKTISFSEKKGLKTALIQEIFDTSDTLFETKSNYLKIKQKYRNNLPDNAYFIGYLTYRSKQNFFKEEFNSRFKGNFKQYLTYLKQKYPNSLVFGF